MPKIDCHVHIVGNGSSGSGCQLNLRGMRRLQGRYMVHHLGIEQAALQGDLDGLYAARLKEMLDDSSLDAVMILALDHPYDKQGRVISGISPLYVPNEYVLQLASEYRGFLPTVSIHPARPDAMDELERCIDAGAVMMKCLPNCHNIDCRDPRFVPFWERMAEAGMLLLAHTGGELSLPVIEPAYQTPEVLRVPLECGICVIAAHAATSSLFDPDYFDLFVEMLDEFPKLYGDFSALNTPIRSRHLRRCLEPAVVGRLVHGSDVPIAVSALWAAMRGLLSWRRAREINSIANVLERDFRLKTELGFPEEVFTRLGTLLPESALKRWLC